MQSTSQIIATNKPTSSFLQAGCPSWRPTNSVKALKGKISHFVDLFTPSSAGGLPTLSLSTNSSWLPWGRVAMHLISPLMPVPLQRVTNSLVIQSTDRPRLSCRRVIYPPCHPRRQRCLPSFTRTRTHTNNILTSLTHIYFFNPRTQHHIAVKLFQRTLIFHAVVCTDKFSEARSQV